MKKAKIGIVSLGHFVYFEQFEGLEEDLKKKTKDFLTYIDQQSCDVYDAGYVEGSSVSAVMTQGHLMNLYDVPELQLDQKWWSQLIRKEATLGSGKYSKLYFTQSNLMLMPFDLTWCIYYNKDIQETNKVENLYDLVRNNEWTIGKMKTIASGVATLGDDSSYTYEKGGTSIYGLTTYWNGAKALLDGGNVQFVTKNVDGEPVPNIRNERFMNLAQELAGLFGEEGTFTIGGLSPDGTTFGNASDYKIIFNAKRALFVAAEVKSSVSDFREYDGNFGVLPLPKYDASQAEYRSWINYLAPVLVLPASLAKTENATRLHNTALLLDVLSFYSERDILPVYYDVVLKGRGARDVDSEEMLDLINSTKAFDASVAYDWSRQLSEVLSTQILKGIKDVSSLVEQYEEPIAKKIEETMKNVYPD